MKTRNAIFPALALIAVALLAFLLRGAVQEWVIIPLARFIWLVKGYYGAFPQAAYWVVALGIAALVAILGFRFPDWERRRRHEQWKPLPGSVREMSFWIQRGKGGIFPKWHIAHLLAELALDILDRRGTRQKHAQLLTGPDWAPPRRSQELPGCRPDHQLHRLPKTKAVRSSAAHAVRSRPGTCY